MNKTDMNLLLRYREIFKERSSQNSPTRIYFVIILVTSLFLGAFALRLWLDKISLEQDIDELNAYISSSEVIEKMKQIELLKLNIGILDSIIEQTHSINTVFDSAVRFDSEALTVLQDNRYTGINFESVSYSKGIIYLDISGTKSSDISNYVLRLTREGYFKVVNYSGYTFDSEALVYRSTIMCTMFGGGLE
jgi:hypothetical protein